MTKDKRKTIVLAAGREGGKWDFRMRISFISHSLTFGFWIEGRDSKMRDRDLHYFRDHLSREYMKGKEIHHDWENGGICYLLETEKHRRLHYE